ncbi:uncharacterized protein RAG0_06078 [Rhynchosporium agropyri]|uniref:Polyketide synthase n=1 Tax=Rhynchosporium agropyri TaxID=914238 RepID=A0A1E1KG60_9HELO|nr:uncharacterized protein RAG0_06078 [Rhynchosporium agropyri]
MYLNPTLTPSLVDLLRLNAERDGNKVAFESPGRRLTHAGLQLRSGRLASHLMQSGIQKGHHVAILLNRCIEAIESIYAITRASAISVPLNFQSSAAEVEAIFRDISSHGPDAVITNMLRLDVVRNLVSKDIPIIVVGIGTNMPSDVLQFETLMSRELSINPRDDLEPEEPAFLHYTSGTTGDPKGVVSSQRSYVWSALAGYTAGTRIRSSDRMFWPLPLFHAFGHSQCIIGTVAVGATTYLAGDDPLLQSIEAGDFTVIAGVPTTYQELVGTGTILQRSSATNVRLCLSGGAPATSILSARVETLFNVRILNRYGCTEMCGPITICRPGSFVESSCGSPLAGRKVQIIAVETLKEVDHGVEGEIWVKSPGMMLGYHKQDRSSLSVISDEWYRTGDLGCWQSIHDLKVTGRLSDLINRSGSKYHPAPIERILMQCPGVKEAIVVGSKHAYFGEVPTAFIVIDESNNTALDMTTLLTACRSEFPDWKVPVDFYQIDNIPCTATGKVKRAKMTKIPCRRLVPRSLTRSSIERLVWREILSVCEVSVAINYNPAQSFEKLGMNSLKSIQLRDRLAAVTGLESLPTTLVFDYSTASLLVEHLSQLLFGAPHSLPKTKTPSTQKTKEDPIAIISMSCKYPGGIESPEDLWKVLIEGRDVMSDFPIDRGWPTEIYDSDPDAIGKTTVTRGGFLHDQAEFDAGLFGIHPIDAKVMDPQQRLLLESTWHLFERARIAPDSVRGSKTGVYVGMMYNDYAARFIDTVHDLEAQMGLGSAASVAAGRLSYHFDLKGPSIAIDTACSSSLVAIHLAAKALRGGECNLAIAGGATIMATAKAFIMFSKQRGLASDGRCKSYSADADGTAWSEGVGLVLLERLSDAKNSGHTVLGLIAGSAVNSDGLSNGITAPNGKQQENLIQEALENAHLTSSDVDVIEGHGTGTALGDPIEVNAILKTYAQNRNHPILLGSAKSNLGHTQAAAGVAGVIKMLLAMKHNSVPSTINVTKLSRHIDWSQGKIEVPIEMSSWPQRGRPRRAAVSAFGIGGTNAHIILEQFPEAPMQQVLAETQTSSFVAQRCPWLLSGSSKAALQASAHSLLLFCSPHQDTRAFAMALATTRSALRYRAAVRPGDLDALNSVAQDLVHPNVTNGTASGGQHLALLFSGQGGQSLNMSRELCEILPIFRNAFEAVSAEVNPYLEVPLEDVLRDRDDLLARTDYAQVAIFAFEVAMYLLVRSYAIRVDYVMGHSIGEYAAAYACGIFTLADAAKLVATRGKLMADQARGCMVQVAASEEEVREVLKSGGYLMTVIAAVNSQNSVVISGPADETLELIERLVVLEKKTTLLRISHACHSPAMDPVTSVFAEALRGMEFHVPHMPFVSTVTGTVVKDEEVCSVEYWTRQIIAPVRFLNAVKTLQEFGVENFLEIGPTAALANYVVGAVPTRAKIESLLQALGSLHVRGVKVDWKAVFADNTAGPIALPLYKFQRQRYWLDLPQTESTKRLHGHPFIAKGAPLPDTNVIVFSGDISLNNHYWLTEHVMDGRILFPATAFAEMIVQAGSQIGYSFLTEMTLQNPMDLSLDGDVLVQIVSGESGEGDQRTIDVFSRPRDRPVEEAWTQHATGLLAVSEGGSNVETPESRTWPVDGAVHFDGAYHVLSQNGIKYGPSFQRVRRLWQNGSTITAELESLPATDRFLIHPALLDSAMHLVMLASPSSQGLRVPFRLKGVQLWECHDRFLRVIVRHVNENEISVELRDRDGRLAARIDSVELRAMQTDGGNLYTFEWQPLSIISHKSPAHSGDMVVRFLAIPDCTTADICNMIVRALEAIQQWSAEHAHTGCRLVLVTEEATTKTPNLASAAAWGLFRSAQAEYGDRILLIDVDVTGQEVAVESAITPGQIVVSIRKGASMVPRLLRVAAGSHKREMDIDGTVLITGGTGALGALFARHMVQKYRAKHLLLISRSGSHTSSAKKLYTDLIKLGAHISIEVCDVSNFDQLQHLIKHANPPITVLIHSAGIVDDGMLDSLTPERVAQVLQPKTAALHLHNLLPDIQTFILFSSAAGILGNGGQGSYAAGNSFLDALARLRHSRSQSAISLAWGPWHIEAGMAGGLSNSGGPLLPLTDKEGLALFDAAIQTDESVLVPLRTRGQAPLIGALRHQVGETVSQSRFWCDQLASTSSAERIRILENLIECEVAKVLDYEELPDLPVIELGVDSFTGMLLRNRISILTGLKLPSTLVFDHPSIPELAKFLLAKLGPLVETSVKQPISSADIPCVKSPTTQRPPALIGHKTPVMGIANTCRQLCKSGHYVPGLGLLKLSSLTLPVFDCDSFQHHERLPRRIKEGSSSTVVICFAGFFPVLEGRSIFEPLAAWISSEISVFEMLNPIVKVPDTAETLIHMFAETIKRQFENRRVILLGFSVGGLVAQGVASALGSDVVEGLVLLDTYLLNDDNIEWNSSLLGSLIANTVEEYTDQDFVAMGQYVRLFSGRCLESCATRTLFLGVEGRQERSSENDPGCNWLSNFEYLEVPGLHFSILQRDVKTTVDAIQAWMSRCDNKKAS